MAILSLCQKFNHLAFGEEQKHLNSTKNPSLETKKTKPPAGLHRRNRRRNRGLRGRAHHLLRGEMVTQELRLVADRAHRVHPVHDQHPLTRDLPGSGLVKGHLQMLGFFFMLDPKESEGLGF